MWQRRFVSWPWLLTVAGALLIAACDPSPSGSPAVPTQATCQTMNAADKQVTDWLAARAIPVTSLDAGQGLADLQPLKEILNGVRVVALGDATYGTHESFAMKHRLVEFLVKEMGVKAVLVEANYGETMDVNHCVRNHCDTGTALGSNFWVWDTAEMAALTDWLQAYNQGRAAAEQIQFLGIDAASPMATTAYLDQILAQVTPDYGNTLKETFRQMQDDYYVLTQRQPSLSAGAGALDRAKWPGRIADLITYLEQQQPLFVAATSTERYNTALAMARNLRRYSELVSAQGYSPHDRFMAETVRELLEQLGPDARVALWAYNDLIVHNAGGTLGSHLSSALGQQYYALGLAFDQGSFWSLPLNDAMEVSGPPTAFSVGPAPAGQIEWYLACAGLGNSIVDFRLGEKREPVVTWLANDHPLRSIGALYSPQADPTVLYTPISFDGLIYIPQTTPTHPR